MPDDNDRRLGQILTLDFAEKLSRLDGLLRRAAVTARRQDADVVKSFLRASEGIRLQARRLFDSFGGEWPLSETEFTTAIQVLNNCFLDLDRLHLQLSLIHVGWPTPEAYTFVKETCGALIADMRGSVSIVLSDVYMFEETELGRYLGAIASASGEDTAGDAPALFLPKIEHENPLQWGILVHEIGHSLEWTSKSLTEGHLDVPDDAQGRVVLDDWAEEVVCDLIALHLLGPAYFVSFVSFINLMGALGHLEEPTETHPDPRFRLSIMAATLERLGINVPVIESGLIVPPGQNLAGFYYELFEQRCAAERRLDLRWPSPQAFPVDFSEFRDFLEEKAVDLLPPSLKNPLKFEQDQLQEMARMLDRGIPIGGRPRNDTNSTVHRRLSEIDDKSDAETSRTKMKALLDGLGEERSTLAEILTAGWLYKIQYMYPRNADQLFRAKDETQFHAAEIKFRDDIVKLDELLRKSIEIMPLFKRFGANMTVEDSTQPPDKAE